MRRTIWLVAGFLLFVLGITGLILQMVGMNYTFLRFLTYWPPMYTFLLFVLMMLAGMIIAYLNATNWREEG